MSAEDGPKPPKTLPHRVTAFLTETHWKPTARRSHIVSRVVESTVAHAAFCIARMGRRPCPRRVERGEVGAGLAPRSDEPTGLLPCSHVSSIMGRAQDSLLRAR
jgi:hypothetical protein